MLLAIFLASSVSAAPLTLAVTNFVAPSPSFAIALARYCVTIVTQYLAKAIAKDGEGATKLVTAKVNGAADTDEARKIAKSIVSSFSKVLCYKIQRIIKFMPIWMCRCEGIISSLTIRHKQHHIICTRITIYSNHIK